MDEPFDGRGGQPVVEESSDDPRTLDALDPLRDAELLVDEAAGHEARPGEEEIPAINEEGLQTDPTVVDDPDEEDGPRIDAG